MTNLNDEKNTVEIMIKLYCNKKHNTKDKLCRECGELLEYAYSQLDSCKYGTNKVNCERCKIHCYEPSMRGKIIEVMRFSGPRMLYTHPILVFKHIGKNIKKNNIYDKIYMKEK